MKIYRLRYIICLLLFYVSTLIASKVVVHLGDPGTCELCAVRTAMEKSVEPTVYYSTVKDPESRRLRMIRFESVGGGPVKQSYVDSQPTRTKNWEHALSQVKGPAQTNTIGMLRASLSKLKASDAGKLVLFEDRSGVGISPASLGLNPSPMPVALKVAIEEAKAVATDATSPK